MWTNLQYTTLVAWFTAVVVCVFGGSSSMGWRFRMYYRWIMKQKDQAGHHLIMHAPKPMMYGIAWTMIAACYVASGTLFAIGYQDCVQSYYIAVTAISLFQLLCIAGWAPLFARHGAVRAAYATIWLVILCTAAVVVLMGLTAARTDLGCPVENTSGIIAAVLWGVPIFWLMLAQWINYQFMQLPKELSYRHMIKQHKKMHLSSEQTKSSTYGYDNMETQLLPPTQQKRSVVRNL